MKFTYILGKITRIADRGVYFNDSYMYLVPTWGFFFHYVHLNKITWLLT